MSKLTAVSLTLCGLVGWRVLAAGEWWASIGVAVLALCQLAHEIGHSLREARLDDMREILRRSYNKEGHCDL